MAGSSKMAIYGAIAADIATAVDKRPAAFFTGSAAISSEGIRSGVDSGCGIRSLPRAAQVGFQER